MRALTLVSFSIGIILSINAYALTPAQSTATHLNQTVSRALVEIIKAGEHIKYFNRSYPMFLADILGVLNEPFFTDSKVRKFNDLNEIFNIDSLLPEENTTALGLSFRYENLNAAKYLLAIGADIYAASGADGSSVFNELVSSESRDDALFLAVELQNFALVAHLLEAGADVNAGYSNWEMSDSSTHKGYGTDVAPVLVAARMDDMGLFDFLLEKGADITVTDSKGFGVLHYAVDKAYEGIISKAISGGADPNARILESKDASRFLDYTPLHLAVHYATFSHHHDRSIHTRAAKTLIYYGANPNKQDRNGNTPAHIAAFSGGAREALLRVLADGKADFDLKNSGGNTVLHMAAYWTLNKEVLDILVAGGADINARNVEGSTPLDVILEGAARERLGEQIGSRKTFIPEEKQHTVELIRSAGGKTAAELGNTVVDGE